MQADYQLLPKRRNSNSDGSSKRWMQTKFFTNYYEVDIDKRRNKIYQYSFQLPEEIPDDSQLYFFAARSIRPKLKEKIGLLNYKGKMLYGSIPVKVPLEYTCSFEFKET